MYIFETFERLITKAVLSVRQPRARKPAATGYFEEPADDSLIGDIIVGSLSIVNFWLLDQATGWGEAVLSDTTPVFRFFAFAAVALPSVAIELSIFNTRPVHAGTLLYATVYIAAASIFYFVFAELSADALKSVFAWLAIVVLNALVAAPYWSALSVWLRIVLAELIVLAIVFITFVVLQSNSG